MLRAGADYVQKKDWIAKEEIDFPLPPSEDKLKPTCATELLSEVGRIKWPDQKTYYIMWDNAGAIDSFYIDPFARIVYFFQVKENN